MNKLIAIIVPVYNTEKYIKEALDSLKNQTYPYFEVFIIDDGSTDKTGEILDQYVYKDKRFHVIHKKNRGVSSARNVGLDIVSKINEEKKI